MKKLITAIAMMFCLVCGASAFETRFMSVDFDRMLLIHNGKTYQLVEVKNKARRSWREVTYLCIDERLKAVAFRLFVTDEGEFLRLQKFTSKK
jgi:hypothetical protein